MINFSTIEKRIEKEVFRLAKSKLIGIDNNYFKNFNDDELLTNVDSEGNRRPYVLIINLKYRGEKRHFAIPLRSNIPSHVDDKHYVSLPPRETTKTGHVHGIHIIKMFPITKKHFLKYNTNSISEELIQATIIKNFDEIFEKSKSYLNDVENGNPNIYGVNIDDMIEIIEQKNL